MAQSSSPTIRTIPVEGMGVLFTIRSKVSPLTLIRMNPSSHRPLSPLTSNATRRMRVVNRPVRRA